MALFLNQKALVIGQYYQVVDRSDYNDTLKRPRKISDLNFDSKVILKCELDMYLPCQFSQRTG